jgi:aminocarboxymuconate-semialdehyde decarboxylase
MHNRREFLKEAVSASSILFAGCGVADAAAQSAPIASAKKRLPIKLKGRKIHTIDIHAHCLVPKASTLLKQPPPPYEVSHLLTDRALAERISKMDAQGIDLAVLSINPTWYAADRDLVTEVIKIQNETLAEFCGSHQDRFAAFASVALQFPDLAAEQLEVAVKRMGLRGAAIGGSVLGQELADPKFHPFFAKAQELDVVIFIHPQASTTLNDRFKGNGPLNVAVWNPIETTLALTHLIFEGTLDKFPRLKICAAHGGGYLPSYMHRSDHGCEVIPNQCKPGVPQKHPTEYLKQMYYDSLVFTPEALRHLAAEVGASQIMMGTDYPFPWVSAPVDHVLKTPGLSDAQKEAILGGTAAKLLRLVPPSTQ